MSEILEIPLFFVKAFLIKGTQPILVDTGTPGSEDKILKKITASGVNPAEIPLIIITHDHYDHFGSVHALKEKTGAKVAIHKLDSESLIKGENPKLTPIGWKGRLARVVSSSSASIESLEPDIILDDETDLNEFGVNGKIIHTPGHTPGSVSVILDDRKAIIGDLVMGGFIRRGTPNYPMFGYDLNRIKESIHQVLAYQPEEIYTSHGGPFKTAALKKRFGL
jgi:hydroxyacylglutathione hydrolase